MDPNAKISDLLTDSASEPRLIIMCDEKTSSRKEFVENDNQVIIMHFGNPTDVEVKSVLYQASSYS